MKKLDNKGMTILELLIYMLIATIFMSAALFLLGSSNQFVSESKTRMIVQNEFRLGSIYIKNSIKRHDFKDGFKLESLDPSVHNSVQKLSFKSESNTKSEAFYIYYDESKHQLISVTNNGIGAEIKPICNLDELNIEMDNSKKCISVSMSYGKGDMNLAYKELIHFRTTKE